MEPTLKDMEDHNNPLSNKKIDTISITFISIMVIYVGLAYLISLFIQ